MIDQERDTYYPATEVVLPRPKILGSASRAPMAMARMTVCNIFGVADGEAEEVGSEGANCDDPGTGDVQDSDKGLLRIQGAFCSRKRTHNRASDSLRALALLPEQNQETFQNSK